MFRRPNASLIICFFLFNSVAQIVKCMQEVMEKVSTAAKPECLEERLICSLCASIAALQPSPNTNDVCTQGVFVKKVCHSCVLSSFSAAARYSWFILSVLSTVLKPRL
jgi:hypothetical protein